MRTSQPNHDIGWVVLNFSHYSTLNCKPLDAYIFVDTQQNVCMCDWNNDTKENIVGAAENRLELLWHD